MTRVKTLNKKDAIESLLLHRIGKNAPSLAEKIEKNSNVFFLKKKETLYTQGDILDSTYHLISGLIKLYRHNEDGKEVVFKYVSPGESFAKSIITGPTILSAEALERCEVLAVDKNVLKQAAFSDNEVMEDMLASCKKEFEFYITHIEDLMLSDTKQRLENFLLRHAEKKNSKSFRLPVAKCELAILLGTTPENLSRIIKTMIERNEITTHGRNISIHF